MSGPAPYESDSEYSGSSVSSSLGCRAMLTSSESDDDHPASKKTCTSDISYRNRTSSRQTERAQRQWAVFDFTGERPGSLMSVPSSWIVKKPKNKVEKTSWCYWPNKGSTDEQQLKKLIKNCSDPHPKSWTVLPGRIKGIFKSLKEAESYVSEKIGTISTSTDIEIERRDKLQQLEHEATLMINKNNAPNQLVSNSANVNPTNRKLNTHPRMNMTSKTVNTTANISKTKSNSNKLMNTTPGPRKLDYNSGNTTPSTSRTSVSPTLTNSPGDATLCPISESLLSSFEAQHKRKQDMSVITLLEDLHQEVREMKQEVRELKQEVRELKSNLKNASECTESIIENPFEDLKSFGFKAESLQERTRT